MRPSLMWFALPNAVVRVNANSKRGRVKLVFSGRRFRSRSALRRGFSNLAIQRS
jgi:hypothetical protein